MVTNRNLGVITDNFHEFWWIIIFSRDIPEKNKYEDWIVKKARNLTAMKYTPEDSRRHQKARDQSGGPVAGRWGQPAPPPCHLGPLWDSSMPF
jgi:hypothetical protein